MAIVRPAGYKAETMEAYDRYASKFDEKFGVHFEEFVKPEADRFIGMLPGSRVLDIGSGPGNHALYFQQQGLQVLCGDLSGEMIRVCQEKGLEAQVMDMERIHLKDDEYDGIWAYASLLHIPKEHMPQIISEFWRGLKQGGLLAVAVKEGDGEGFEENEKYPKTRRWFVYFTDEEMREIFGERFELLHATRTNVKNKYVFLNYLFRVRK